MDKFIELFKALAEKWPEKYVCEDVDGNGTHFEYDAKDSDDLWHVVGEQMSDEFFQTSLEQMQTLAGSMGYVVWQTPIGWVEHTWRGRCMRLGSCEVFVDHDGSTEHAARLAALCACMEQKIKEEKP